MARRSERRPTQRSQRDAVLELLGEAGRSLRPDEIAAALEIGGRQRARLARLLDALVDDGVLRSAKGRRFELARSTSRRGSGRRRDSEQYEGALPGHPRGLGFIACPALGEDVWLPGESMAGALHGDSVRFRVVTRTQRGLEGAVTEVVARRLRRVGGLLHKRGRRVWLDPDDSRIR